MCLIAPVPLPLVRGMGFALGCLLYALARSRRGVVRSNLLLCFPEHSTQHLRWLERKIFINFAQAWLDRSWLWHGSAAQLSARLQLVGDAAALVGAAQPTVLFAPHFMGLDAGWTALNTQLRPARRMATIYAAQSNAVVDDWILQGRKRWGDVRLFMRGESVRGIAQSLKAGEPLYLLPDMDMGAAQSFFVPFFGVPTATVPSLARFAQLGGAQVRSVRSILTAQGYRIEISTPWPHYPTGDLAADTARMNRELEDLITLAPDQYYWVHKRFKTRPSDAPAVY